MGDGTFSTGVVTLSSHTPTTVCRPVLITTSSRATTPTRSSVLILRRRSTVEEHPSGVVEQVDGEGEVLGSGVGEDLGFWLCADRLTLLVELGDGLGNHLAEAVQARATVLEAPTL